MNFSESESSLKSLFVTYTEIEERGKDHAVCDEDFQSEGEIPKQRAKKNSEPGAFNETSLLCKIPTNMNNSPRKNLKIA